MEENKEMTVIENGLIADLTTAKQSYSSMQPVTKEEKALLFKAMNNPDKRIRDCVNMTINAKDVYCEIVTCTNQETGEVTECPRTVIIDADGVAYQAVSMGVFNALTKVIQVFGVPSWETPIPLVVKQISKGTRNILTFDVKF